MTQSKSEITADATTTELPTFFRGAVELAKYLECDPVTVRRMMRKKALPYIRLGGRYLFRREDIDKLLERHTVPVAGSKRKGA